MKKILFVVSEDSYFLSHRLHTALFLKNKNYEISLATCVTCNDKKELIESKGIQVYDLLIRSKGLDTKSDFNLMNKLIKIFNKVEYDYIHAVSIRFVFISLIAFKFSKAKNFIGMITGLGYLNTSNKKSIKIIKKMIMLVMKVLSMNNNISLICQNHDDYNILKNHVISSKKLFLIKGSGVNTEEFKSLNSSRKENPIIVTLVSRMLLDKGVLEFINAAKLIRDKGYKNICCQLVGDIHDANPNSLTTSEIEQWHESAVITWLGHRSDISNIYNNSDMAVLPSYGEGLPKSLLEACSCGLPIIATDVPGCREICINNKNGIVVPVKNSEKLADAIIDLAFNKEKRVLFGKESRRMVLDEFSESVINQKIFSVYNK